MAVRSSPAFLQTLPVGSWTFDDEAVEFALALSRAMAVVPTLRRWRDEERERLERHAGGAPQTFSDEALWVAMLLAALHFRPMLATTFRDILYHHISPTMRTKLGLEDPPDADDAHGWAALHRRVRTRLHSLLEAIDPSPFPKDCSLAASEFENAVAKYRSANILTDEILELRRDRLTWTANRVLEVTFRNLPRAVRRRWTGSVAVDATPVPAFARPEARRPRSKKSKGELLRSSADPDAGLYIRTVDGKDPLIAKGGNGNRKRARKAFWAYEATLIVSGTECDDEKHEFPSLVVGMAALHRPAESPGRNAVKALASVRDRGHPANWLAGDRAYTNALAEDFRLPVLALGYEPVLDYTISQLGIQGSFGGALLIDGAWYCPEIPRTLIDTTTAYREGRIDEQTWRAQIEARRAYRFRRKGAPDDGHVRLLCPASDGAPSARCDAKPRSLPQPTTKTRIYVVDATRASLDPCCRQQSLQFPPTAGGKLEQFLQYGTREWSRTYSSLRNTIEGMNGIAKDGAYSALRDPSRRRIRGVAAQTVFVALQLLATNLQKITSFLRHATVEGDGVARHRRKPRRTTTPLSAHNPGSGRHGLPPP